MNVFLYCFVEIMHMRYSTKPRKVDESLGWFTLIINTSLCPSAAASKYPNTFLTPICTILIQTVCTFISIWLPNMMQCSLFQIYHARTVRSRIVFTNVQTLLDASVGWRLVSFPASQIHPRGNSIPLRVCKCRKRTENIEPQINDTLLTTQLSTWPMVMCSKPTDCPIVWLC